MYDLTIGDFILFPVYLLLVILLFKKIRQKYSYDPILRKYFTWGFYIKIGFIVIYTVLVCYVIYGDSVSLFFDQGQHFLNLIIRDTRNIDLLFTPGGKTIDALAGDGYKGYLSMESNYMVVKISVIFCFLTFSKYLLVNLLCGFIAFLGSWQLFKFFYALYPQLHKFLAIACMGVPTVLFWSSGISKDTICIACLGFLTKSLYDLMIDKRSVLRNTIITIAALYLIYTIKAYILICYLPFLLFFLILLSINKAGNLLLRTLLKITIPLVFILLLIFIFVSKEELFIQYSSDKILSTIQDNQNSFQAQVDTYEGGSFFSLGEFDGSISSLAKMAPNAIMSTFFRPFPWECRSFMMIISSMEGLILMFLTLQIFFRRNGLITFFRTIFTNSLAFNCFFFALSFALFVGISTFNFGSLARYKMPCIPFYFIPLFIINSKLDMLNTKKNKL